MTWERKLHACVLVSILAARVSAKECQDEHCGQAKEDTEDQSLLQFRQGEVHQSVLQAHVFVAKPLVVSSGLCSQPITTEAECQEMGGVTSDTDFKNSDGFSWGGDVANEWAPSGCLWSAPLVPAGIPHRIYFNSYANSEASCGETNPNNFNCVCGGSEASVDGGDDDYYYYVVDADGDATGGKGGKGNKNPAEWAAKKAARKAAWQAKQAEKKSAREAKKGKGDVVELVQRRTQEHDAENATQKTALKGCRDFHFTASYNGKEYAADCNGEYMDSASRWNCYTKWFPGYEPLLRGVRKCASEDGSYDHIPEDKWSFYTDFSYGKRAGWIDNGYSDRSGESCNPKTSFYKNEVDCVLYTK